MSRILNILIVLLALNLLGAAGLWYGYGGMQAKKNEQAELRQQIANERQKNLQLSDLRTMITAAEKDRVLLGKYFLDSTDEGQIKFLSQIERLGLSTTGAMLEVQSLNLSSGAAPVLRGDFSFTGSWGEVFHVLRILEEFPARLVVNRFNATRSGAVAASGGDAWGGSISIEVMSLKAKN
jgi:hypothetical protein